MLARLCGEHLGFRWLCGGVSMNHPTLSDFRVAHPEIPDRLLTRSFAACLHAGLADVERVAQDGIRARAGAGAASFRRQRTLAECHELAKAEVARLRAEVKDNRAAGTRRQRAAQERAARDREARVGAALRAVEALADGRAPRREAEPPPEVPLPGGAADKKPAEPRASTTDVDARVMKMADGGFRPAFNVQFATAAGNRLIAARCRSAMSEAIKVSWRRWSSSWPSAMAGARPRCWSMAGSRVRQRDGSAWLSGGDSSRVLRGGSWLEEPNEVRSARRGSGRLVTRINTFGFWIARTF